MENRIVQVTFYFAEKLKVEELEPVFTAIGDDWVRFSALSWLLWTAKPSPHIYTLIKPHLAENDQILIAPLRKSDFFGYLSPWVWGWIHQKLPDKPLVFGPDADALTKIPALQFKDED